MRSILVLFFVVGLLASQAIAHSYWIAVCEKSVHVLYRKIFINHAFCDQENYSDCENKWQAYSIHSKVFGKKSPCYAQFTSFRDNRGQHTLECNGEDLVALRHHENQAKDNCTTTCEQKFKLSPFNVCITFRKCGK